MSYTDFHDISDVCEMFDCDFEKKQFVSKKDIKLHDFFMTTIKENLNDNSCFLNEFVICEDIIKPIIKIVAKANNLPVWSHVQFDVDKAKGLNGTADYIFAPAKRGRMQFKLPIVCLGEAKKDDFIRGWGQTAAEMIAAQIENNNTEIPIYGLVTNGISWQFGQLKKSIFTIDERTFSATRDLQEVLDILNLIFCEARKNADILLEIEAKKN